jgi:predicted amidohydrolase YtcJ
MMKFKFTLLLFLTALLISSCVKKETNTASGTLYFGGDILTMEGDKPQYAEAIVQVDGKIVFVGSKKDAADKYKDANLVDLKGKTLVPGFIDAHSHITMGADALNQANLNPEPVGKIENIGDIVKAMQDLKTRLKASDTAWLVGSGYDQDFLKEKRHPTKEDLDAAFPTNPVLILHTSGHMVVANSAALKKVNYTSETKDPTGGTIVRKKGTNEPEGLIQEVALLPFETFLSVPLPVEQEIEKIVKIQEYYTSCGITTANDAMTSDIKMKILETAAKDKRLKIDVIAFPMYTMAKDVVGTNKIKWAQYDNRLKYAGLKMTVDGSPQGKTAYLTKAYQTPVPGCTHDCKGFSNLTQDMVNELFELCYKNNVQLYSHCNGDASIDMMIKGHEYAISKTGDNNKDRRTVIVHSQIIRPDQLDSYKKYGLIPSFFTNHTFYWGDVHVANLGEERASYLSPMKSALDLGLQCTNHTDYTVTPMDQMFILWTSVNRLSRTAKVIGPSECISPYEGLKAFTISAAHQYFEEKIKGSIKEGKLADFVILDQNPLKIDAKNIKDIKVLETIKEGKTVYTLNK